MLSEYELDYMRAKAVELMPGSCSILAGTATVSGQGGVGRTWGTVATGVRCRLDAGRDPVRWLRGEAMQPFGYYVLTLPFDTVIAEGNRVVMAGGTYSVEGVDVVDKSWAVTRRARVVELNHA